MQPQGVRLAWSEVPPDVRDRVGQRLASPVVDAQNQPGGFSPGVAARCRLADGRRYFIKAVSSDQNPRTPDHYRREARVAGALPTGLPVPNFIDVIDDGHWVVLIFDEVDGQPPELPWSLDRLAATFSAIDDLVAKTTPCPVSGLPTCSEFHAESFAGYRQLAGGDPAVDLIDDWSRRHLARLAELEAEWEAASVGDSLLHSDLRADNLLVRGDGSVVIVDWPHANVGAAWTDKAFMLPSVEHDGGPSPIEVERALHPLRGVDSEAVDRVIVGLAGYFTLRGAQPDPPGLPTVRAHQRAQGTITRAWLAQRLRLDERGG